MIFTDPAKKSFGSGSPRLRQSLLQGYGSGLKEEEETHMTHMNVNVTSSGQGTRTVVLQIPRVRPLITIFLRGTFLDFFFNGRYSTLLHLLPLRFRCVGGCWDRTLDSCYYGIGSNSSARSHPLGQISSRYAQTFWMRSSRVVRESDSQCRSRNCPGFDPSIFRHNGI